MGSAVYSPGQSILETYINAQKAQQEQAIAKAQSDAAVANTQADTEHRKQLAKETAIQLETEHQKNLQALAVQQAQIDLAKEQLQHAHMQSVMDINKGITEGIVPVPPQQPGVTLPTPVEGVMNQLPPSPKQPLTYGGITLQPNEYNTPQQAVTQKLPIVASDIAAAGSHAQAVSEGTEQGAENVRKQPGGLYDQQINIENLKTDNAQKIADVAATRNETVARINAVARTTAASINAASRIKATEMGKNAKTIDPDELETRANQLAYGEGSPAGKSPLDMAAASVLQQAGKPIVSTKTVDNIKTLKPLENFSSDMTAFANKYLGDGALSGLVNAATLNAPIATNEKNAYNQLLLNATNIAKGVEGATGRILMAQIQTAKDFVSNKNITKGQMLENAKKLNDTLVTAVEGQLGNMKPADRVDFLSHYGFNNLSAYSAKRWKVSDPTIPQAAPPQLAPVPTKKLQLPVGWVPLGQQ